jgi:hypothetical protein
VEHSKKEVPHQNACTAVVPFRSVAIVFEKLSIISTVFEGFLTGNATDRIVASIAHIRLRRAKQAKLP